MTWSKSLGEVARAVGGEVPSIDVQITGVSTDTRTIKPGDIFVALSGPNFDANDFVADAFAGGAVAAIAQQPSDEGPVICVDESLHALQLLAANHRDDYSIPITAITGSCGKTSVKDYTGALLSTKYNVLKTQGNLNNEIGCPLTLLRIDDETEHAIVEMGANHKGEIARLCEIARPTESLITIIAPAHLEGFGSIDDVAIAKGEIAGGLSAEGTFYVNADDPRCAAIGEARSGRKVVVGDGGDVRLRDCQSHDSGDLILDIDPIGRLRLPLATPTLAVNVLFAVAIGLEHGVEEFEGPLRDAMETSGRIQRVVVGPYTILDDTYNANPASMAAAIDALGRLPEKPKAAAFGDMLEMGDEAAVFHRTVGEQAAAAGVSALFTRGDYGRDTIAGAREHGVAVAQALDAYEDIADAIIEALPDGGAILVKGSRGMKMERVIDAIRNRIL